MIPADRADVLDSALAILEEFGRATEVRGRFVALYLGLRRMGADIAPLGAGSTPAGEIEHFLDGLYTKTHRLEPFVVLTALFGQSTSPEAPYAARSGVLAPGRNYPTNTWRNNFAIQKGIGCPAEPAVIQALLLNPVVRLACAHMAVDPEGRHLCTLRDTSYRGEEHSIWLRMTGEGYQVVDLDVPAVYERYVRPANVPIPVFPLIAALYSMAPAGAYPARQRVGIPDFASDFRFDLARVEALFDCDPESPPNAALIAQVEGMALPAAAIPPAPAQGAGPPVGGEPLPPAAELPLVAPERAMNTGVGAELAVAADIQQYDWEVRYRGNQPGIGYDLEAIKDGLTLRIEVKSSVAFTNPELQQSEWEAAQRHGDEYVLAVVDFYGSDQQRIWYVRDPAGAAVPAERHTLVYRFLRADVLPLATEAEFL